MTSYSPSTSHPTALQRASFTSLLPISFRRKVGPCSARCIYSALHLPCMSKATTPFATQ